MPKKTCFIIGPIDDPETEARKRADALLKYIIKEVLEKPPFDMTVDRADEMQKPGLIPGQVIERVVNADLVVADLADSTNPNVFYELALRHVSQKPVVHMLLENQKLPFDIAPQRTIYYNTTSLASADQAKKDLAEHAAAVLANPDSADNPISAALLTLKLLGSRDKDEQAMGRLFQEVSELRQEVRSLRPPAPDAASTGPIPAAEKKRFADLMRNYELMNVIPSSAGLTPEVLRTVGPVNFSTAPMGLPPDLLQRVGETIGVVPVKCANCGQPIAGQIGRRSADNAPIHLKGECPPRTPPASAAPST